MDWMNTIILAGLLVVLILTSITAYMNFRTWRLIKKTQSERISSKGGLDDRQKG